MINTKKLIKMVRKWQRMAVMGRKRISLPKGTDQNISLSIEEGHFVVYSMDGKRFIFPISYLNTSIFRELLVMSEEEFGLPSDGPITFPCDASFMEYMAKLIHRRATKEVEQALMMSLDNRCSYAHSLNQQEANQVAWACAW